MRVEEERRSITSSAIIISLVAHLCALVLLFLGNEYLPELLNIAKVEKLPDNEQPYIIADIFPPEVERRPDKARYLGLHDSTVKEEMVAREIGRDSSRSKNSPKVKGDDMEGRREKKDLFAVDDMYKPKLKKREEGKRASRPFSGLPEDFYPDYRRGEHTYLNVLRYPHIDYFVRLKRKFKLTFNPGPPLRDHFAINQVMRGTVEVVLGVTVGRDGGLKELFVFKESGIPAYDAESLRTVRASSPFASPPKEFLENDGLLRMSWTFTTYL